jgi:hypothetical protein
MTTRKGAKGKDAKAEDAVKGELLVYRTDDGLVKLEVRLENDTADDG